MYNISNLAISQDLDSETLPRKFILFWQTKNYFLFSLFLDRTLFKKPLRYIDESESEVAQSCLTLCNPMDCSLPGSTVHGIFQVRILEWVAISFSRGSSWPRDPNLALPHCRHTLYRLSHQGSPRYMTIDKLFLCIPWRQSSTLFNHMSPIFALMPGT